MRHPKMLSPDQIKFVEDCLNSGKTQTSYCASQGVPMSKFYYLLKKYRKLGRQGERVDGGGFVKRIRPTKYRVDNPF